LIPPGSGPSSWPSFLPAAERSVGSCGFRTTSAKRAAASSITRSWVARRCLGMYFRLMLIGFFDSCGWRIVVSPIFLGICCSCGRKNSIQGRCNILVSGPTVAIHRSHGSDDIFEKRELRDGFSRGPHPAIVLPAATDRTKRVRTKRREIYRYFLLLTLCNLFIGNSFIVNSRRGRW